MLSQEAMVSPCASYAASVAVRCAGGVAWLLRLRFTGADPESDCPEDTAQ